MISFFYGLLAVVLAYFLNKLLLKLSSPVTVTLMAPWIEEPLKTLLPVLGNGNLIIAHMVFGFAEGLYDLFTAKKNFLAFVLSLITHTVFGLITLFFITKLSVFYGIIIAALGHTLYNLIILKVAWR
ncbi:hypothetical protein [Carboxydothermus pertinax]|uniref:Uncharacterized protein n=1 Tax=Carboxydothermus pertinax TaxID=870242 RepID=A0A1L8CV55_9THEO|nr:hypothetical protein [Carboxydothermus pertinax]GAV22793.1 hypothetical protein cpu_13030 [Carboxydothermus pertinax]